MKEIPDPVRSGVTDLAPDPSPHPVNKAATSFMLGSAGVHAPAGCICPPGANVTCEAPACPRKPPRYSKGSF